MRRHLVGALLVIGGLVGSALPAAADDSGQYLVVLREGASAEQFAAEIGQERAVASTLEVVTSRLASREAFSLRDDPRVEALVPDQLMALNLPSTPQQFQANSIAISQRVPNGVARLGTAQRANGAGVGVAVLDTGIDLTHPDLKEIIAGQVSFVPGTTSAQDDNGHGTHIAGIIAARDNGAGVRGVAPGVKLYAVKVLDQSGSARVSTVLAGLDWVKQNAPKLGIKVVNLSMGGQGRSDGNCGRTNNDVLHKAICDLVASGVMVVVAAGNSGVDSAQQIPAAYPEVVSVSALIDTDGKPGSQGVRTLWGADDTFASFSNWGAAITIAAPGVSVLSTYRGGGYATLTGTSMAAPHVVGAAALYWSINPTATVSLARTALVLGGEHNGFGHTDPTKRHTEPVVSTAAY